MTPKKIVQRLLLVTVALGAVTTACSLVVNNDTVQCSNNEACRAYNAAAVCSQGVCVTPEAAAQAEAGGGSCTPKVPETQLDILNESCTNASCIDFNDCERLGLCNDASLPALLPPGDGGVR